MRAIGLLATVICCFFSGPIMAQKNLKPKKAYRLIENLDQSDANLRNKARKALMKSEDLSLAPALVEALFFNEHGREDALAVLEHFFKTGYGPNYKAWVSLIGSRLDIEPKEGYLSYKGALYGKIDPNLKAFFNPSHARTIRPQEIISGGVVKDGIPALFKPRFLQAAQAQFMGEEERVFGVAINGDVRAYPFRIMDWHEMANDVVGGVPVSLSYCTLCGSGILFDTRFNKGQTHYTFGSSGLLYRSNKLMYDHQTNTLWSNLTGEPVMGKLVGKGLTLKVLPLVVTTWGAWVKQHPNTKVLSTQTGYDRNYQPGAAYGSYFDSPNTMFPVWNSPKNEPELADKDWMWVAVYQNQRKAWPVSFLMEHPFHLDQIQGHPVVLITNPTSQDTRVYHIGKHKLEMKDGQILTSTNVPLNITEDALISADKTVRLNRVPGHRIYWFSWGSFFPDAPYQGKDSTKQKK